MQAPTLRKGWLSKQSRQISSFFKNWKRRYFVLDKGVLRYYENPSPTNTPPYGEKEKGFMNLVNAHVIEPKRDDEKTRRRIMISAGQEHERDMLLEADSPKEAKEWVEALRQHCRYASSTDKISPYAAASTSSYEESMSTLPSVSDLQKQSSISESVLSEVMIEGQRSIEPLPWFVMKVIRIDTRAKVFVNVCHHQDIPSNNNLRGTSKWPFVVSNCGRTVTESKATDSDSSVKETGPVTITIYDVLVSSQIVNLAAKDENVIDEVCRKIIRHLTKYYKEKIEDDYKLPKIKKNYKGDRQLFLMPEVGATCPITGIPLKNGSGKRTSAVITSATRIPMTGDLTPSSDRSLSPAPSPVPSLPVNKHSSLPNTSVGNVFLPINESGSNRPRQETQASNPSNKSTTPIPPSSTKKPTPPAINLPSKCKHIPYQIQRSAGTIAKKVLDSKASGKVLPGGEIVYAISRQITNDGMPWLHTTVGWIPERLPGQGIGAVPLPKTSSGHQSLSRNTSIGNITDDTPLEQRIVIPTVPGLPESIQILNTRFMELNVTHDMMSSIGSYFSFSSSKANGNAPNAAFKTIFLIEITFARDSIIKLARTFQDIYELRLQLLQSTDKAIKDVAKHIPFPTFLDGDRLLFADASILANFIEDVSSFLNGLVHSLPADKFKHTMLTAFFNPTVVDVNLMELDLMATGGLEGIAEAVTEALQQQQSSS